METKISNFKLPEEEKRRLREIANEMDTDMTKALIHIINKIYNNEIDREILKNMERKEDLINRLMKTGLTKEEAQLRIMSNMSTKKKAQSIKLSQDARDSRTLQDKVSTDEVPMEEKLRYNEAAMKYNKANPTKKLPLYVV